MGFLAIVLAVFSLNTTGLSHTLLVIGAAILSILACVRELEP